MRICLKETSCNDLEVIELPVQESIPQLNLDLLGLCQNNYDCISTENRTESDVSYALGSEGGRRVLPLKAVRAVVPLAIIQHFQQRQTGSDPDYCQDQLDVH